MKKIVLAFSLLLSALCLNAQQITVLTEGTRTSIRGLSVVDDNVVWVSGSGGMVARSTNGGKDFTWMQVKGYEKMEFRDIEAFDSNTAIIMGIEKPAVILKTRDGGNNWYKVFEDTTKGMFLDAMAFHNDNSGFGAVVGDPIDSIFYNALTNDYGETWIPYPDKGKVLPAAKQGEAFFASSGTNFTFLGNHPAFVSGGKHSRILFAGIGIEIPMLQGKESTGGNSFAVYESYKFGIIVGGDFSKDTVTEGNCILIKPKDGLHWGKLIFTHPQTPPHGYRSCVIYINEKQLITCGTSGIDISNDGGNNWQLISKESYHVVQKAKKGTAIFIAGNKGRIAKVIL